MSFSWFAVTCVAATIALTLGVREYCTDPDGYQKDLGVEWDEGVKRCDCIVPESLSYFWDGTNPSDAIKHCLYNGCPTDESRTEIVKEDETFKHGEDDCICRSGTSSFLADAWTRYHAVCETASGLLYEIDFDSGDY